MSARGKAQRRPGYAVPGELAVEPIRVHVVNIAPRPQSNDVMAEIANRLTNVALGQDPLHIPPFQPRLHPGPDRRRLALPQLEMLGNRQQRAAIFDRVQLTKERKHLGGQDRVVGLRFDELTACVSLRRSVFASRR